jgi:hypothetical protein
MDYGFGKTYEVPAKAHHLNGAIQFYTLTAGVDLVAAEDASVKEVAEAQANLLRVLEVLRTFGGQPVITKVEGSVLKFTLEQANVYGKGGLGVDQQVSAKGDLVEGAKAKIEEIFGEIPAVKLVADEEGHILGEDTEAEAVKLFKKVEVEVAF